MRTFKTILFLFLLIPFSSFSQSSYVYQEEFSSKGNWPIGNNTTRELNVYNGRYYFDHKRAEKSWRVSTREFNLNTYKDFEIETSIQKISGVSDYGITFMYDFKDDKNYRELGFTSGGYFRVAESLNGTYKNLKSWTKSNAVKSGNYATNKLKIVKKGSRITFYINGTYVFSTSYISSLGKQMAVTLYRKQKVSIDYFRVKYLNSTTTVTKKTTTKNKTILFEGFNNNNNDWATSNTNQVGLQISNGDYIFNHKRTKGSWYTSKIVKFDESRDFRISAQIKKISGIINNGFGLIFGRKDNDNQNQFFISANGSYSIKKYENGKITNVKSWTSSSHIKTGNGTTNYLEIRKEGNKLKYYINSKQVYTSYSFKFYGDRTGFVIYDQQKISIGYLSMAYLNEGDEINTNNTNSDNIKNFIYDDSDFYFSEQFKNNSNDWAVANDDKKSFTVKNGKYYLHHKRDEKGWATYLDKYIDTSKDFEIETKIDKIAGVTGYGYGLIFGKKDNNDFRFYISSNGYYKVVRVVDDKEQIIQKWTKDDAVKSGNQKSNRLKVKKENGFFKFYINNFFVYQTEFENFYGNRLGYVLYNDQEIAVDFLRVKYLNSNTYVTKNKTLSLPLFEDFSNNSNNWFTDDLENYSSSIYGGKINIHRKKDGGIFIKKDITIDTSKDFIIETEISREQTGATGLYGITFGRKNSSNEFTFLLSTNGSYMYRKFDNNVYKKIIPLTFDSAIKTGVGESNKIKIVKSGLLLRFYINDVYMNETAFESFFGNSLGYTVYYEQKIAASYLNIKYQTASYNNPPLIVITEPNVELKRGFKIVETKNILVRGKATDSDGIYEIKINGVEAKVSEDGTFVANVPLKYGKNDLMVVAKDIKQASSNKHFIIKRNSPELDITTINNKKEVENLDIGFGKYYALLIGVSEYEDESIVDLNGEPTKDAQALADVLISNYSFDKNNVIVLKDPTENEINKELFGLQKKVGENDNLIIFYAGHGYYDKVTEKGFWMPSDANMQFEGNVILNTSIVSYIKAIKSKHTLLIADACFSGTILTKNRSFKNASKAVQTKYELPSRKAITSGAETTVPNRSVFMKYLLKRLEQNNNQYLSAGQLFNMIEDPIINNVSGDIKPLYAPISRTGDEGGDFIFVKRN